MKIELRPHIGHNMATGETQTHAQDMIYLDGKMVGFVGHQPNAPVNLIVNLSDPIMDAIETAVHEKKGETGFIAFGAPGRVFDDVTTTSTEDDDDE